jgi:putative ABC transport system substrate-binding protein
VSRQHVDAGGLLTYGVSEPDLDRRTAAYVDKILKGRRQVDSPIEQPTKFELVINLKSTKQIGLALSSEFLSRANQVNK